MEDNSTYMIVVRVDDTSVLLPVCSPITFFDTRSQQKIMDTLKELGFGFVTLPKK